MKLRVAILSVHTCPLAAPGGKETGGHERLRATRRRASCAAWALHVDVFTRSQNSDHPARGGAWGTGARVIHLPAGPEAPMPREDVHPHLDEFVAGVERFRARERHSTYDLIHAHYWLSGVAGLALREMWDAPLVQMFHTLGRLKNTVAQTSGRGRARAADRRGSRGSSPRPTASSPPTWWSARTWSGTTARAPSASRSSRAASTPSCSSRWRRRDGQGPARARRRSRCSSTWGDCSRSRDSRPCSRR